ncbi:MAG: cytochrome c [Bacteroidota bacterium]|nr:cytochrome c [Bacteroidota bacterium]
MKNFLIIAGSIIAGIAIVSCNKVRRNTGRAYMPDMVYSVAYETYAPTNRLEKSGASYNGRPVEGTIARGDFFPYTLKNDSTSYAQSAATKNPLTPGSIDMKEAERLYLVNCGICHGSKLDGNGPLWKDGSGPFTSAPRNFMTDPVVVNMPEGTMFQSVTYGKNMMGSYASQLSTRQRWMVIAYIKSKQAASAAAKTTVAAADSIKKAMPDSAMKKK